MVYTDLCSFYFSVFDEHAVDMTLKEFVELLRGERWKAQVEEYQRLKASGRETEAKKLKRKLAALVIAGRCDGSHAETNLKQWSGDAMLDVDKCNGRVSEFLQVLKDTPWVKAAWRSVSYDGLKLVVRVEAESVDEYRLAYALVAWHVAQLLAFPCDMSCKNPTRPCFASYDPEAFFRPDTEVFPWRRFVTEHPDRVGEILAELKVKTPAGASGPPVAASGMLHTFFNEFLEQNPFVDGKKNEFLLKLGRIARYKGVGEEELARLKTLAVERLAGMGCAAGDIPPRIDSGYRYADMNKGPETPASRAHKAQGSPMRYSEPNEGEEEAELEKLEADKLRRNVPCLPDELFDRLPDFLKRGLTHVRNKRERDILLLSMITNISGCLPGVRMNYGGMVYSADLYLVALAGSGRGKGVMQLAAILPRVVWSGENPGLAEQLKSVYVMGVRQLLVGNLGQIKIAKAAGFAVRGDFGLNIYNSRAMHYLRANGIDSQLLSFEMTLPQIRDVSKAVPAEVLIYGRLPLMVMENCVMKNRTGTCSCQTTQTKLIDRMGEEFPIVKDPGTCRNVLLNGKKLYLLDKKESFRGMGLWALRLQFTTENAGEVDRVLSEYRLGARFEPGSCTRGLYNRGVE